MVLTKTLAFTGTFLLAFYAGMANAAVRISPKLTEKSNTRVSNTDAETYTDDSTINFLVQLKTTNKAKSVKRALARRGGDIGWFERGHLVHKLIRRDTAMYASTVEEALETLKQSGEVSYYKYYGISNTFIVDGSYSAIEELATIEDSILSISPNFAFAVNLPQPEETSTLDRRAVTADPQWNQVNIGASTIWNTGNTGGGLRYANADTGVQFNHPVLLTNYAGNKNGTINHNYAWWDGVTRAADSSNLNTECDYSSAYPCDDDGHGTHTTGTAVGGSGYGVAPGGVWMACRNMDAGTGRPEYYLSCLNWIIAPHDLKGNNSNPDLRPHSVGNSYTCPEDELCDANTFDAVLDSLYASGIFMSISAGNSGSSCSTIFYPPENEVDHHIFNVAAVSKSNNIASFSSRGPISNIKRAFSLDLSAPGVNVVSTYPTNNTATLSGTSMASPHIAGAVLLVVEACPHLARNVDGLSDLFHSSAKKLYPTSSQRCGNDTTSSIPNNVYGYGVLNVTAAICQCKLSAK